MDLPWELQQKDDTQEGDTESTFVHKQRNKSLYSNCGFITFKSRRCADTALVQGHVSPDSHEFIFSRPPVPHDVIYDDLQSEALNALVSEIFGSALMVLLFVFFLTLVVTVVVIAKEFNDYIWVRVWGVTWKSQHPNDEGAFLGSLVLTFVMSLVPSLLLMIFGSFFSLKSSAFAQAELQNWYFVFLVIFVILVTAIQNDVAQFAQAVLQTPTLVIARLAICLPATTHFYLNFVCIQYVDHIKNLLRPANLLKFCYFRFVEGFAEDEAKKLCEPEDQTYNGIGSRCARFSLIMVMTITFCTVSPLMCPLAIIYFILCRAVYGFLIVFSETQKPDLGGVFWVALLRHVSLGLLIFITLMIGVLYERAATSWPALLAAASFIPWTVGHFRRESLHWLSLSVARISMSEEHEHMKEVLGRTSTAAPEEGRSCYRQVELLPPDESF